MLAVPRLLRPDTSMAKLDRLGWRGGIAFKAFGFPRRSRGAGPRGQQLEQRLAPAQPPRSPARAGAIAGHDHIEHRALRRVA